MDGVTEFEQKVIDAFLVGADARLDVLRTQAATGIVTRREHTGVGSFTDFRVAAKAPRLVCPSVTLGDVDVEVVGVENVAALLFVRDGRIAMLEFALPQGEWPADPIAKRIGYFRYVPLPAGGYSLVPTPQRDLETLEMLLAGRGVAA